MAKLETAPAADPPSAPTRRPPVASEADALAAVRDHFAFVCRSLRRHGVADADLDDLVQDVFLVMWRRWKTYDPTRRLEAWLAGIAFRVARNHGRRRWREIPTGELDLEDGAPTGEEGVAAARARALVLAALARIPARYRETLVLYDVEGLGVADIASLAQAPEATIYTRLRRGRLAFAEAVRALHASGGEARFAALAPAALLELERTPPGPSPTRQRKAEERFRRMLAGRALPLRLLRYPLVAVAAAVALVGAVAFTVARRAHVQHASRIARVPTAGHLGSPVPAPAGAEALARGLVGWWRLDDGGLAAARDSSGEGRDCTIHGLSSPARWIDGVHGRALDLAGTAWLACPQPDTAANEDLEITVSAWVQRTSARTPAAIATRQIGNGFHDQYLLEFASDGLRIVSHAWSGWAIEPAPPPVGRWFHAAFTHDRSGVSRLYVDGKQVAVVLGQPLDRREVRGPITFGAGRFSRAANQVRQRLDGALDDLMVHDRALPPEEIAALAAGAEPAVAPR